MAEIKVDVRVSVNGNGCAAVNEGMNPSETSEQPTPDTNAFDVNIISRDGTGYWKIKGSALGPPTPVAEADERDRAIINTMLTNDLKTIHEPWDRPATKLLGTFFVNLSAFKK